MCVESTSSKVWCGVVWWGERDRDSLGTGFGSAGLLLGSSAVDSADFSLRFAGNKEQRARSTEGGSRGSQSSSGGQANIAERRERAGVEKQWTSLDWVAGCACLCVSLQRIGIGERGLMLRERHSGFQKKKKSCRKRRAGAGSRK